MKKLITILLFHVFIGCIWAQNFAVSQIPSELKENAYAVIRKDDLKIEYLSSSKVKTTHDLAITVMSEAGVKYAFQPMFYNKSTRINKMDATLYDAKGIKSQTLKNKDVRDVSAVDGFSMYLDDRIKYFDLNPVSYPFTIHYNLVVESSNTLFLPKWTAISDYNVGVENSSVNFINHTPLAIRIKETGFENWEMKKSVEGNSFLYSIKNIPPLADETLSPPLSEVVPGVVFAPTEFQLEGVKGRFENWTDFGKWYYDNLLKGKQDLSESEKRHAKQLVDGVSDPVEKVRILYQYLQTKTRYINVSIGIGGWQPYPASYVDSKSYGDCKALSNYMMSLLETVGVEAFYTIVTAENSRKVNIDKDFAYMQGNHIILNVPNGDETIWLECTSQQTAFNYLGKFTDDRYALSITPQGGKIVRTQTFPAESNQEIIKGKGEIQPDGKLKAEVSFFYNGLQYDHAYRFNFQETKEQKKKLQDLLFNLPNLNIKNYTYNNNWDKAEFTLNLELESSQFAKIYGNNMAVNILPAGLMTTNLKKDNSRKFPFEIRFGYNDETEFEITIPHNYKLEGNFEPVNYNSEFGNYKLTLDVIGENTLLVKRKLLVKDGEYPKEKFNDYVEFIRKISSYDNSKILLEKL